MNNEKLYNEKINRLTDRFEFIEKALNLQAKEYERRLEALNHENDRIQELQAKSISVDKFEGAVNQLYQKFDQTSTNLQKDIKTLSDWKKGEEGQTESKNNFKEWIPWLIAIAALAYNVFRSSSV